MVRVMIAQRETHYISLSVFSMARVMITQWENEYISMPVLSMARVTIAQWENECISLPVLFLVRVQFPVVEYFERFYSAWLITVCQPILNQRGRKWLNLPLIAPRNLFALRRKVKVQPWADNA